MIGDLLTRALLKVLGLKPPTQQQLDALDRHIDNVLAEDRA